MQADRFQIIDIGPERIVARQRENRRAILYSNSSRWMAISCRAPKIRQFCPSYSLRARLQNYC